MKHKLNVVQNTTCFAVQSKLELDCQRSACKQWINYSKGHNCVLIAVQNGPQTLQEIGDIYGVTRMRICQVEKETLERLRKIV